MLLRLFFGVCGDARFLFPESPAGFSAGSP